MSQSIRAKAAKGLVGFLSLMLLCTMVSRGIYAYQMPRVEIGQVSQRSIFHTLQADGVIEAARETAFVLMEGIRIREVCIKTGEKVEPDSILFVLDLQDLEAFGQGLKEKIQVAEEKIAELDRSRTSGRGDIMEQQYALAHLREQQDICQGFLGKKGKVESGMEGYVTEICVKAGDRTTDSAAVRFADCSENLVKWDFKAVLTEEQVGAVKVGDAVNVHFQNGRVTEEGCLVSAVRRMADGTYEAIVPVTQEGLSPGETGTMEMTSQSRKYGCCVPVSALHQDGKNDYLLLIRETDTILGTELSVIRRDVAVVDQNEATAALEENAVGAAESFVVYADKEMDPGDKVRLFEEEDGR